MQMLQKSCIFKINTCIFIKNVIHCCGDILKSFCIHEDLFCGEVVRLACRKQKREVREPPLRRRDKLCSVPIFEMKISHTLRCPSFSAKSHVCFGYVPQNVHITPSRHYQLFAVVLGANKRERPFVCGT